MEINRDELLYDIQAGREKLKFGNPVLCMDWVHKVVEKYAGGVDDLTESLASCAGQDEGWAHILEDTSILIARLEHYLG